MYQEQKLTVGQTLGKFRYTTTERSVVHQAERKFANPLYRVLP